MSQNRKKKTALDMTHGSMWDKILLFALPLMASSVLQQLLYSADTAVVGRFAGSNALAAVGANGAIINLLINMFLGLSTGANVVLSMYVGKGDKRKSAIAVHTAVALAIVSGFFLLAIGLIFGEQILGAMGTPDAIIDQAIVYFKIYFAGMPFAMLYNFEASVLQSIGDTRRPLVTMTIAGVINLLLNLLLVVVLHLDVAGVALATVLSNAFSSIVLFILLLHEEEPIRLFPKSLRLTPSVVKEIAAIGIPAGLQGMMFSIANVIIARALNGLGPAAIAGSQAGSNAEEFAYYILISFANAAMTFISQNRGAGRFDRCRKAAYLCISMGMGAVAIYCCTLYVFAEHFVRLFSTDPEVIRYAMMRVHTIFMFEIVCAALEGLSGAIRGYGKALLPTVITVFGICVFRMIWIFTVFAADQKFTTLMKAYPISWSMTTLGLLAAYLFIRRDVEKKAAQVVTEG